MFYETYKLALQLVMMTWGSVNCFVEMLLFFQYFNIFFLSSLQKLKKIKIPKRKPDQNKLELNFKSFLPENEAIALFSIQNPFKFLSASGLILIFTRALPTINRLDWAMCFGSLIAQGPVGGWWWGSVCWQQIVKGNCNAIFRNYCIFFARKNCNPMKDDCSTPKLLRLSLIVGNFYDL